MEILNADVKQSIWLVGADVCLYFHCSLEDIPHQFHTSYLNQKIKEKSPFKLTGHHIERSGKQAMLWLWDSKQQQALQAETAPDVEICQTVPEHLLLDTHSDGLLERCAPGFTLLEMWRNQVLEGFSCFAGSASATKKEEFERRFSAQGLPWDKSELVYLEVARHIPRWWQKEALKTPQGLARVLYIPACLVFALFLGVLAGKWLALVDRESEVTSLSAQAQPDLQARSDFQRLQLVNLARLQQLDRVRLLSVVAEFEYLVGDYYLELREWQLSNNQLRATLILDKSSGRQLLEALQRSELFQQVKAEPGLRPDTTIIVAELQPAYQAHTEYSRLLKADSSLSNPENPGGDRS